MALDYVNGSVEIGFCSSLEPEAAESLLGKTIYGIKASEYGIRIKFTDGTELYVNGSTYGDCPLGVELEELE